MPAVISEKVCIHCGSAFRPTSHRPDFCCAGCQFVHDLIQKNGLGQFYDLQEGGVQPVKSLVFQKRDYQWLEELINKAEASDQAELHLDIQGLSCLGCVWLIERLFSQKEGGLSIRVDPTYGHLDLQWQPGQFDVLQFAQELQSFGYLLGPLGEARTRGDRGLLIRMGICAALAMNTMLFTLPSYLGMEANFSFAPLFHRLALILGTLSLVIGGSYFFVRTWHSIRQRVLHIDLPISLGLLAAYAGSVYAWQQNARAFEYFDFVSTFTFLMLVGRWLQQKAVDRNRHQLLAAHAEPSAVVSVLTGEKIPCREIIKDCRFTVESGQVVPVRSRLHTEAGASLNLEWINGESDASVAHRGSIVPAGAVNCGRGVIELEALEGWSDSLLARLLQIAPEQSHRNHTLERFIRAYIWVVVSVAVLGFCGWWIATGALLTSVQVLISILVVSCPCASGVALPLATDLATSRLRQGGVFIRNLDLWARIDRIRKVIFDKTGTLTLEAISLRNPEVLGTLTSAERSVLLAMVQDNLHPVSGCIREQLLADGTPAACTGPIEETIGFGLELKHGGAVWKLGRHQWAGGDAGDCVFTRNGAALAHFYFGEEARGDAAEEIAALRKEHDCTVSILSGDRKAKVHAMAERLSLPEDQCLAELSPEQKAAWIETHDRQDSLFIGDGANDSLAFDAAWCTGTPAVDRGLLEQKADFYFLGRGLNGIRALLDMALRRRRTVRAVIAFALLYNVCAIAMCLAGHMNPLAAAVLMPASSLVSLAIVFIGLRKHPNAGSNNGRLRG